MISVKTIYDLLLDNFGHQHWWPIDKNYHQKQKSDPRFEIIVGAILTQNTAWTNVEKALENLKKQKVLTINAIIHTGEENLKIMIQPSGFFNQKARRLKLFATYLHKKYQNDIQKFFSQDLPEIRHELLSLQGIGPETADSILLYAGNQPTFVVDVYTKRICKRVPIKVINDSYDDIKNFFENELQKTIPKKDLVPVYKELHALLVTLAKNNCRKKKPECHTCPLNKLCKKSL
jgi:endonuclease III related protein